MEVTLTFILLFLLAVAVGCALGTLTGLIPGLHVNTVALLVLSSVPAVLSEAADLDMGISVSGVLVLVGSAVVALSMAHTFLDFIPGAFLGAPDSETALSILPAHRLLLKGRGYTAVYLSAVGSFGAVITALIFIVPYWYIFGPPMGLYDVLRDSLKYILPGIVIVLLLTETRKIPYIKAGDSLRTGRYSRALGILAASGVFLLSGVFGLLVLSLNVQSPLGLPSSVLFPALSGLFGISTLIISLKDSAVIPPQKLGRPRVNIRRALPYFTRGGLAGSVVGFMPGMTGAQATVLASLFKRKSPPSGVIVTMSAVNTSNAFFVLVALFLISKARSGAAIVLNQMIDIDPWINSPPQSMMFFLMSAVLASAVSYFVTLYVGRRAAGIFQRIDYKKAALGIIFFISIMVLAFTGPIGILILIVSTLLGFLPPQIGIRRTHLMGILIVPVLTYLWGI